METFISDLDHSEHLLRNLPIWTPWILVNVERNVETYQEGRAVKVGTGMTKQQAWDTARVELESRPGAIAMAVRRDGEPF